jgi:hypothetical protein
MDFLFVLSAAGAGYLSIARGRAAGANSFLFLGPTDFLSPVP